MIGLSSTDISPDISWVHFDGCCVSLNSSENMDHKMFLKKCLVYMGIDTTATNCQMRFSNMAIAQVLVTWHYFTSSFGFIHKPKATIISNMEDKYIPFLCFVYRLLEIEPYL